MGVLVDGSLASGLSAVSVIMAGGSGTRFWPLSREQRPKQYLPLGEGKQSLIQETAARMSGVTGPGSVLVVTAESQRQLVREQLPDCCILSEPIGRNTAPCVGLVAQYLAQSVGDLPMICVPADHLVRGQEQIAAVFRRGLELSAGEVLVTIGIAPTKPETGYGYIRCAVANSDATDLVVEEFVEKPSLEKAEQYLEAGNFYWNSGMFVWRPSAILSAIERYLPELSAQLVKIGTEFAAGENNSPAKFDRVEKIYWKIAPVSIDVGVMEKADNVVMLAGDSFYWSDIGSWSSWAENVQENAPNLGSSAAGSVESGVVDQNGNYFQGQAVVVNSSGCAIAGGKRIIAAVGLKDLIIVDTDDALLVCSREGAQDVRSVVENLRQANRQELL